MASSLKVEIDRRPFLTRAESVDQSVTQPSDSRRHIDGGEIDGSRRQPLYLPGEGQGTEPASNRSVSTLAIHAVTAYAKEQGLDGKFYWAASTEYWEQGVDLGSLYTLRRLATSVGLDWDDLWPKLESGGYHNRVLSQHEEAKKEGIAQTPSFRVNRALHSGAMSFEELRAVVQAAY